MGAPKQKWTAEEEAALKAGVIKHGAGKWRTILKDPEFSGVLYLRSNVDLKDKWRNMSVMANGWGSREKPKVSVKRVHHVPRHEDNSLAVTAVPQSDEEMVDVKPLAFTSIPAPVTVPKRSNPRLDNLIMEAIRTLKEPGGSDKTTIAAYIEMMNGLPEVGCERYNTKVIMEQYVSPEDFRRFLSVRLKYLTANGRLIKVKRRYRIAPTSTFSQRRKLSTPLFEGRPGMSSKVARGDFNMLTKSEIEHEIARMKTMTPQEAARAAARAVAEAEAAIADAEEAAREAEAAEADAEAAQAFAEAAQKTYKGRPSGKMMIRA